MKKQIQNQIEDLFKKNFNLLKRPLRSKKAGLPPGTLTYTGTISEKEIEIKLIKYDADTYETKSSRYLDTILSDIEDDKVNWLNVDALYETGIIEEIGEKFKLHPLILEDLLNTQHMPKTELEDDYAFVTMKMLSLNQDTKEIEHEHVSFILGKNYVISFQERKGDVFNAIRERLEGGKGRARKRSADYLLYLLIDAIVDNYYLVMDELNDKVDDLEEQIYYHPSADNFEKIINFKKQLIYVKKSITPLETALRDLADEDFEFIDEKHFQYYSDVQDHLKSIIQDVEVMREVITGLVELYMSSLSNKMNNVMTTLTVIASIFIPLTFVAGVYGMNFKYMPELEWHWGYPAALGVMALIGIIMFAFMKRKHWF